MRKPLPSLLAFLLLAAAPAPVPERSSERELMILTIENMAATAGTRHNRIDPQVLAAMHRVPRHLLGPEEVRAQAYRNTPLPIGYDQTISQPYIVALMSDLLDVQPGHKVLEVGTGSGYQAAVLAHLVGQVYTIEIVEPLAKRAAVQLRALGYDNVTVRAGDGYAGWPEHGPFDRIIVTAGAAHIPKPLVDQLRPGGIMVVPVGSGRNELQLTVVRKDMKGRIRKEAVLPVRFVPLVRARS